MNIREIHKAMHKRCRPGTRYHRRGIQVCPEWKGIAGFRNYLLSVLGEKPNDGQRWTLDRIENDRGYEPGNIRWATYRTQLRNRSDFNVYLDAGGRRQLLVEWAEETGLPEAVLRDRVRQGWPPSAIVSTPVLSKSEAARRRWNGQAEGTRR